MFVYFIKCNGFVKIGIANNPKERLLNLQVGNPYKLELLTTIPGDINTERILHKRFKKYRVSNRNEWFVLSEEMEDYIKEVGNIYKTLDNKDDKNSLIAYVRTNKKGTCFEAIYVRYLLKLDGKTRFSFVEFPIIQLENLTKSEYEKWKIMCANDTYFKIPATNKLSLLNRKQDVWKWSYREC